MKKIGLYFSLVAILALTLSAIKKNDCDVHSLKKELLNELKPDYKYNSSNTNKFVLESKKQGTEIQVPLFSHEKYRFLFNTAALPHGFEILIYDKKHDAKNRKLLFSIKGTETYQHIFVFEPEDPQTMYIDYMLPATEEEGISGCVVFLLGYKIG